MEVIADVMNVNTLTSNIKIVSQGGNTSEQAQKF